MSSLKMSLFLLFAYVQCTIAEKEEDDVYPAQRGFWTPAIAQKCEMHYFGGSQMPSPKSITFGLYLMGSPQILVSSKYGVEDEEYNDEVGSISEDDGLRWFETTIDLVNPRARVFNLTLIIMEGDLLFLDKIILDLGDDTTAPTEPPPTTTRKPIDEDNTVLLDTNKDYWLVWEDECTYIEDYVYYWAFGCPVEPEQENYELGYWNPCSTTKSCRLRFKGSSDVLPYTPDSIKIYSYIEGDAKINITIQGNHDDFCEDGCTEVGVVTRSELLEWKDTFISQEFVADNYTINIELLPGSDGIVLLDKISLFQPKVIISTTTPSTTATSTPPTTTVSTPPTPTVSTPPTPTVSTPPTPTASTSPTPTASTPPTITSTGGTSTRTTSDTTDVPTTRTTSDSTDTTTPTSQSTPTSPTDESTSAANLPEIKWGNMILLLIANALANLLRYF